MSAEAVGSLSSNPYVGLSGLSSSGAFGSLVAGAGVATVAPSSITSNETFGDVQTGVFVYAVAIESSEAHGLHVVVRKLPLPPATRTSIAKQDGVYSHDVFQHDPDAILDYAVDWNAWLPGTSIASVSWSVPSGITIQQTDEVDGRAIIWLSSYTSSGSFTVSCTITDDDSPIARTDKRTFYVNVREK